MVNDCLSYLFRQPLVATFPIIDISYRFVILSRGRLLITLFLNKKSCKSLTKDKIPNAFPLGEVWLLIQESVRSKTEEVALNKRLNSRYFTFTMEPVKILQSPAGTLASRYSFFTPRYSPVKVSVISKP